MDIKLLKQEGYSIRKICELTGYSRNTVRKALRQRAPKPFKKPAPESLLDQYKPYIEQRYKECGLSSVRMIEEIRVMGYEGGIDTLRRFIRTLKAPTVSRQKMTVRFETPPGKQAQADWAYCGRFPNQADRMVSIYCFVVVMSFSRAMYVEFTTSMKLPILIECHLNAFNYFNGWPQTILYDNMKQVRIDRQTLNPLFVDFVSYYGITAKTHRPYRPRTKGKVERMVHYVKDNFLNGRTFIDISDLNTQVLKWLETTANSRIHSTTNERPCDLLAQEKESLTPLNSIIPYQLTLKDSRIVDTSGFVRYKGSRYSVPPVEVGKIVIIEQGETTLRIRSGDLILAEHPLSVNRGETITIPEHIEQLWQLSLSSSPPPQPKWEVSFKHQVQTPSLQIYEEVIK